MSGRDVEIISYDEGRLRPHQDKESGELKQSTAPETSYEQQVTTMQYRTTHPLPPKQLVVTTSRLQRRHPQKYDSDDDAFLYFICHPRSPSPQLTIPAIGVCVVLRRLHKNQINRFQTFLLIIQTT